MDFYNNLLSDISNFAIVVFGFCISLYTLLYSFILNKKEQLKEITDLKKSGERVTSYTYKETNYINYIKSMKSFNKYIIICLSISLPIYFFSLLIKYYKLYNLDIVLFNRKYEAYTVYLLLICSILLFIYIVILIVKSIKIYNQNTKI